LVGVVEGFAHLFGDRFGESDKGTYYVVAVDVIGV
jgi:hypothetical protein